MMQGLSRKTRVAMRRRHRRRGSELNIVNFIDILTVLVFFLLVNSTGVAILGVNLPGAQTTVVKKPPLQLSVSIYPDALSVADNKGLIRRFARQSDGHYDLAGLGKLMKEIKTRRPNERKITLLLTPNIPYNALIEVMDTVREQPTPDNSRMIHLFPDIQLGDAAAEPTAKTAPRSTSKPS